jgi:pantoate--beta-alanine ligase
MKKIETINDMKRTRRRLKGKVGLVPTMGYLHEGHLSLVRRSVQENNHTVVSIFVNPAQFGPNEDFERYPRDYDRDFALLDKAGVDYIFLPTPPMMYPAGFNTWVEVDGITSKLEGAARPGHFKGVTTVVNKLFNIIQPDRAYFGQKDGQQCAIISKMIADINMNVDMIISPTVREPDGLAMSSRNVYLSTEERKQAPVLYESLNTARRMLKKGERKAPVIKEEMIKKINEKNLAEIDYVSIANASTLEELEVIQYPVMISLAVRFGNTRLIDNILV